MTTLQKTLITATIAAAVGTGIYEARQASTLRTQVQTLQQQQAPLAEQNQQLIRERDDAARQLAALRDENERLNGNTTELIRLRGKVSSLLQEQPKSADVLATSVQEPRWTPQQFTNVGVTTPLDALQTILWAASTGNTEAISTNLLTSLADFGLRSHSDNLRLVRVVGVGSPEFKLLSERKISEKEVQFDVEQKVGPYRYLKTFDLHLVGDGWKVMIAESPEGLNPHLDF